MRNFKPRNRVSPTRPVYYHPPPEINTGRGGLTRWYDLAEA